jgi:hypothetical protein
MVLLSRPLIRFTRLRSQKSFLALLICLVSADANDEGGCEGRIGTLVWARGRSFRFKVVMHCFASPRCRGINKKPPRSRRVAAFADSFAVENT